MLTWDIVNIAAVHQPVAVLGVAERRQVGGIGGTGSDVAPEAAWGHGEDTVTATGDRPGTRGRHREGTRAASRGLGGVKRGQRGLVGVRGRQKEGRRVEGTGSAVAEWTAQCPR